MYSFWPYWAVAVPSLQLQGWGLRLPQLWHHHLGPVGLRWWQGAPGEVKPRSGPKTQTEGNEQISQTIILMVTSLHIQHINLQSKPCTYCDTHTYLWPYGTRIQNNVEPCYVYFKSSSYPQRTGGTCRTARAYLIPSKPPWRASHWSSFNNFSRTSTVIETPVSFMWRRATPSVWAHVSLTGATT